MLWDVGLLWCFLSSRKSQAKFSLLAVKCLGFHVCFIYELSKIFSDFLTGMQVHRAYFGHPETAAQEQEQEVVVRLLKRVRSPVFKNRQAVGMPTLALRKICFDRVFDQGNCRSKNSRRLIFLDGSSMGPK